VNLSRSVVLAIDATDLGGKQEKDICSTRGRNGALLSVFLLELEKAVVKRFQFLL
jgi:hypothetical protein